MRYSYLLFCITFLLFALASYAQKQLPDSLLTSYTKERSDTGKLKAMWHIIDAYLDFRADSALLYANRSLSLATKIKSIKYQSLTYKQMGDAYKFLGDYPNALTYYFKRLEMDEQENDVYKKAVTYNSLGSVYNLENDFGLSLIYFQKADSIITTYKLDELKSLINVNLCDVYEKMNNYQAAFRYGKKALAEAQKAGDDLNVGISFNNIANVFAKTDQTDSALIYYQLGIPFSKKANGFQTLCEMYLGIAQLMEKENKYDSAFYNARLSASFAQQMNFNKLYMQSCSLLSRYFAGVKLFDSAYYYQYEAAQMKDSIFNDENAKRVQLLTINEAIRQEKIKVAIEKAKADRSHELQLLAIGLLIPVFFFISVLLSKRKIKPRVVELTGILSLLMSFEYITLLIHPAIQRFTNDTPVYEIIILIAVAAILTPAHHRIEEWLLHRLTVHKRDQVRIITKKISQKKPD